MAKPSGPDDNALIFRGRAVSEEDFSQCVRRVLIAMKARNQFGPKKTARLANLDDRFLRRVQRGEQTIGLFSLFKIASAAGIPASKLVAQIEAEIAKGPAKD